MRIIEFREREQERKRAEEEKRMSFGFLSLPFHDLASHSESFTNDLWASLFPSFIYGRIAQRDEDEEIPCDSVKVAV